MYIFGTTEIITPCCTSVIMIKGGWSIKVHSSKTETPVSLPQETNVIFPMGDQYEASSIKVHLFKDQNSNGIEMKDLSQLLSYIFT